MSHACRRVGSSAAEDHHMCRMGVHGAKETLAVLERPLPSASSHGTFAPDESSDAALLDTAKLGIRAAVRMENLALVDDAIFHRVAECRRQSAADCTHLQLPPSSDGSCLCSQSAALWRSSSHAPGRAYAPGRRPGPRSGEIHLEDRGPNALRRHISCLCSPHS